MENPVEMHVVSVLEQTDDSLIPDTTPQAGHVFGVGSSVADEMAVYKLENKAVSGNAAFQDGGRWIEPWVRDALNAAFEQIRIAPRDWRPACT